MKNQERSKPTRDLDAGSADTLAAVRHAVYLDLLSLLPAASIDQTDRFIANLALARSAYSKPTTRETDRELFRIRGRHMGLKVTPDIHAAKCRNYSLSKSEIEEILQKKFGDRLSMVAGFFKIETGSWHLNLPEECAVYGYKSRYGSYLGLLFQPLDSLNNYFLLSSSKYGGCKALRLEPRDQIRFDACKHSAEPGYGIMPPINQANLTGMKWNSRRFIEV